MWKYRQKGRPIRQIICQTNKPEQSVFSWKLIFGLHQRIFIQMEISAIQWTIVE